MGHRVVRMLLASVLLGLTLAGSPRAFGAPAPPALALSPADRARVESGEIVLLGVLPPGADARGSQGGTAVALVHAAPETVWRVLVDYPAHSGLFPRVVNAQVLETGEHRTLVHYVVGVGPFSFGFHVNNYPDDGHRRLDWRLAEDRRNDLFRANVGYWQIDPDAHGVLLTYAMAARTVLPAFLTRGAERDGLVDTLKAVRARAEQASADAPSPAPPAGPRADASAGGTGRPD
jgi:ribosome-associated toxin RatA of RatAB toxin-antitoxin module